MEKKRYIAPKTSRALMLGGWALAVAAMAAGGIQAFFFYRCPACRSSLLWYRGLYPAHCPHCGKPL